MLCVQVCEQHQPLYQAWGMMEWKGGNLDIARDLFQRGVWADPSNRDATRVFQVSPHSVLSFSALSELHAARRRHGLSHTHTHLSIGSFARRKAERRCTRVYLSLTSLSHTHTLCVSRSLGVV